MQFSSSLVSLVLAAISAQALPGSPIDARQDSGLIVAEFFADNGCQTAVLATSTYGVAGDVGLCFGAGAPNYASTLITSNNATHTLRVFAQAGCSTAGRYFDVLPNQTGCFAQQVQSVEYL